MKSILRTVFCLALASAFVLGLSLVVAPDVEAGATCPPCYVPSGASGWSTYGSCIGGPKHCPAMYTTYRNNFSGQICRGQNGIPI
ncbi:MAG: hypothetical protein MPN21_26985 [Thermoanaerobaculia bacterium]|nr:hypothetical protein [Thermoanaerobaculia bacterium]